MSNRVGIIGYPISHSISPVFQQAALDYYGIEAVYQAWEVEPSNLASFAGDWRKADFLGCNVTVPHKETVIACLDHVDEWAKRAGAVNTVVNAGGRLGGHNTDGQGFIRALVEDGHLPPAGLSVLVLGAGGSARGVCLALAREGARSIKVANRTLSRAQELVKLIQEECPEVEAIPLDKNSLGNVASQCHLIVNCTTLGMRHGPGEGQSPLEAGAIPPGVLVYDLVYNPPVTPLLEEASRAGANTLGGLPMLVYQGAASFELWTGKVAPVDVMLRAAEGAFR